MCDFCRTDSIAFSKLNVPCNLRGHDTRLNGRTTGLHAPEVEQDGRRALLRTAPRLSIDPICRALGLTLPPVFQEMPTDKASIRTD